MTENFDKWKRKCRDCDDKGIDTERTCSSCGEISTNFRKHRNVCKDCERDDSKKDYHQRKDSTQRYTEHRAKKGRDMRRSNPEKHLYSAAKNRATKKNIDFTIEICDIIVPDMCPVLGIPVFVGERQSPNSPTIDRVDNTKGYTKDNICVISWRANNLKSDATVDEIRQLYEWVTTQKEML